MSPVTAQCPSCGAPIEFRYDDTFVRVCSYCNAVVARADRGLASLGRMGDLAVSESPLALFASGHMNGLGFQLVGRAQIVHSRGGSWEEWYARFDDGTWGWLSEAQGRFQLSFASPIPPGLPPFESLVPGDSFPVLLALPGHPPEAFVVAEVGEAEYRAAAGELPYRLEPGLRFRYADLSGRQGGIATIDVGVDPRDPVALYVGRAVTLAQLGIAPVRPEEPRWGPSPPGPGRAPERVSAHHVACVQCGGSLELRAPDAAMRVTCLYCAALLDVNQGHLSYLRTLDKRTEVLSPDIPLGTTAVFDGKTLTVIGCLQRSVEVDEVHYPFTEYLLYQPELGYRWLVESAGQWSYVTPLAAGAVDSRAGVTYGKRRFRHFQTAEARVDRIFGESFHVALYGVVAAIGILVGLELPLLMRLLSDELEFKDLVSRVLTFDYIGALVASLLFPLLFVPRLGLVRTSLLMGIVNAGVALAGSYLLAPWIGRRAVGVRARAALVLAVLLAGLVKADALSRLAEEDLYADEIVYTETTPYQRIVVTGGHRGGFQLFLNGNLQFSSADEYRYHEALVHPAMAAAGGAPRRVLILGGGDGLALREVLAYPSVEAVTLVDLDPAMTRLAADLPSLRELNRDALRDRRVTVVNQDALIWLAAPRGAWDVVVIDFPDPNSFSLGKLYTTRFYRLVQRALAPGGAMAVQATSPLFARRSFWCIVETMRAAGLSVHPYHSTVPSFGVWGFALARATPFAPPTRVPAEVPRRYLDDAALAGLFRFPADMAQVTVEVNQLDNQILVRYYEAEWRRWEQ